MNHLRTGDKAPCGATDNLTPRRSKVTCWKCDQAMRLMSPEQLAVFDAEAETVDSRKRNRAVSERAKRRAKYDPLDGVVAHDKVCGPRMAWDCCCTWGPPSCNSCDIHSQCVKCRRMFKAPPNKEAA